MTSADIPEGPVPGAGSVSVPPQRRHRYVGNPVAEDGYWCEIIHEQPPRPPTYYQRILYWDEGMWTDDTGYSDDIEPFRDVCCGSEHRPGKSGYFVIGWEANE